MTSSYYHEKMHRLYRAVRRQVAAEIDPSMPSFAEHVRRAFARQVERLELVPPRDEEEIAA